MDKNELLCYVSRQLNNFFPDGKAYHCELARYWDQILDRTRYCFSKIELTHFSNEKEVFFNHLHGDQYAIFLYYAANTLYRCNSDIGLCTKLFLLNKYLHALDAFYEVELPDIFLVVHPLGTVLGRGKYSNYFLVYQRCNIGSNKDIYPIMQEYVSMHPGSSILGNCFVEKNCRISTGSLVLDKNLDENTLYIGNPRDYTTRTNTGLPNIWR